MNSDTYAALKKRLQTIEKAIVKAHVKETRGPWKARVKALHAAAETGGTLDTFAGVLARRAAVQFLLRTVYVRVMEDLGLLDPPFIRGRRGYQAFREVAPSLGVRHYLRWVFRDLAVDFPDLFRRRDDELPLPPEGLCQQVWDLWHDQDPETNSLLFDWVGEGFDSRFLGDLYQDLDADVRKRFALLQTPDFVEAYILDHTLSPAIEHFDPAAMRERGERFRLIDPTCGSGHFLIGAFHRLADYWKAQGLDEWAAVEAALDGVWGCDINPHAVHIARVRLLLEVIARTGVKDMARLRALPMHLRVMDSLIPWEGTPRGHQVDALVDERLGAYGDAEERAGHRAFLGGLFHVVVGNPPYITPKDTKKRDDYRRFWPESATGKYGLSAPFVERFFSLGVDGAWMGQITGNAFMKRSFGVSLIEKVLPRWDLTDIVDTSGAYIPGHGTPTVTLFGRCRPPVGETIRVLGGKRGEPKAPDDPARGKVWSSIVAAGHEASDDDAFVTVSIYRRPQYQAHPWNVNGGGAPELETTLRERRTKLASIVESMGVDTITRASDLVDQKPADYRRGTVEDWLLRPYGFGDGIRDYHIEITDLTPIPYRGRDVEPISGLAGLQKFFWPHRTWLGRRFVSGGTRMCDVGLPYHGVPQYPFSKHVTDLALVVAFVATHAHFCLDRGGNVFKQSAPLIKLARSSSIPDHLDLLGLLNSSTLGFWMRQVFFSKGGDMLGDGARASAEVWSDRLEYDSTKLKQAPITDRDREHRVTLATALDATAEDRAACLPAAIFATPDWTAETLKSTLTKGRQRYAHLTERMVALQEELDWLTYQSYGLLDAPTVRTPDTIEPMAPGHRPFEIVLARHNATCDPDERSAWFTRHGHDEVTEIPERYSAATRALIQERVDLIAAHKEIRLIEQPQFKRRWQLADFAKETRKATRDWLLDRLEDLFAPGRPAEGDSPAQPRGPLAKPTPYRLEAIVRAWGADPRVAAVAAVFAGDNQVDLSLLAEQLLSAEGVPDNIFRVYTDEGLRKLRQWQEIWRLQDREDAGETVQIPKPPELKKGDFVRDDYYKIRGKLNVPRERFIVYADLTPVRFGWNGWRDKDRALAQLDAYEVVEQHPTHPLPRPSLDDPRRCGATIGLWESLPDVKRWSDAQAHGELLGEAKKACGQETCPCEIGDAWRQWRAGKLTIKSTAQEAAEVDVEARAAAVKAVWQAQTGGQLSIAPDATSLPGATLKAIEKFWRKGPSDLPLVLESLIASGDLTTKGKGSRAKYFVSRVPGSGE